MRRNVCLEAVISELQILGIPFTQEPSGSGHIKVRWQVNPRTVRRLYIVGVTPSDGHAHKNARADVRRMLRQDGAMA